MRRLVLAAVAAAGILLGAGLAPAAADPVRGRWALEFDIACGGETLTVVITSGVPAHVVGGTGNLLLRSIRLTDLATGEVQAYTIGRGRQVGLAGEREACRGTFVIPETGVAYAFEAVVTRAPRGGA